MTQSDDAFDRFMVEHKRLSDAFDAATDDDQKLKVLEEAGKILWPLSEEGLYGNSDEYDIDDSAQLDDEIWQNWDERAEGLGRTYDPEGVLIPLTK